MAVLSKRLASACAHHGLSCCPPRSNVDPAWGSWLRASPSHFKMFVPALAIDYAVLTKAPWTVWCRGRPDVRCLSAGRRRRHRARPAATTAEERPDAMEGICAGSLSRQVPVRYVTVRELCAMCNTHCRCARRQPQAHCWCRSYSYTRPCAGRQLAGVRGRL